jgi:hypothetical protein
MITIDWIDEHEIKTKKGQGSRRGKAGKRQKFRLHQSRALPFNDYANEDTRSYWLKLVEIARKIWHFNWLQG